MFNYFFKTLKIAILSGSLLSFQAFAQEVTRGTNNTDRNGVITNTKQYKFDKVTDSDMLAGLAMLAGGFVTGRMIKNYHPITNDVMIAGAAGAIYIAGEVISNVKFKGTIDEMTVEVQKKSDGKVNEEQVQRLQDLKKSYEEAKGATQTKKTLQMAAAAAFTAAALYATYLGYMEQQAEALCMQAIANGAYSLKACTEANTPATASLRTACTSCDAKMLGLGSTLKAIKITRALPGPTVTKYPAVTSKEGGAVMVSCTLDLAATPQAVDKAITAACDTSYLTMLKRNQVFTTNPAQVNNIDFLNKLLPHTVITYDHMQSREKDNSYLESLVNLVLPRAEASWLPLLGLGVGMAAALLVTTQAVAVETDNFMLAPYNRAMVFAGFAAVAFLSSQASANVIEKLDANIKKIDNILNDLETMAKGIKAQNLSQQQIAIKTIEKPINNVNPFSSDGKKKTECLQSNSTENCKPAADTLQNMPGFANLPDSFKDIASQSVKLGDSVSGKTGVTGATLASADALASKQNALSKMLKQRQDAYEKLTNTKGSFAKGQNAIMDRIKGALRKSLQQQGVTASGLMASVGGNPVNAAAAKAVEEPNTGKSTPVAANVVDTAGSGKDAKENSLNLNFKDAAAGENLAAVDMSGGTHAAAAPEYQIDSNEINGQNGPSLFEVISSRYIKSGYPKLLEEEPVKN